VELLIDKGFDPKLGARPLKRAIQRLLEDPFAEFILRGQIPAGSAVRVSRKDDKLDFGTGSALAIGTAATTSSAESVPPVPSA
jgi:ATP-dependent Clp protease ATP-binding subunit ClpA